MAYNLPSLCYTYSIRVIGIINSLEQSNSSPNDMIFMKAINAATMMHIPHNDVSARI